MPTSDKQGKFIAKALVSQAHPWEIWDVGPGEGSYYDLLHDLPDRHPYWIAIEVWEPYIAQHGLRGKYDLVVNKDVRDIQLDCFPESDNLIIFGDVLEHMPEDDARQLILRAKQNFRWILVSIPIIHAPQGEVNGNPYEAHVKHWDFDEMHEAMGKCMAFKGHTIGLYWWDSEEDV